MNDPFDTQPDVSLRLVGVQLRGESPGYRDLELELLFAVCEQGIMTFVTKEVRLSPLAFEALRGILHRAKRSWLNGLPLDLDICPDHPSLL